MVPILFQLWRVVWGDRKRYAGASTACRSFDKWTQHHPCTQHHQWTKHHPWPHHQWHHWRPSCCWWCELQALGSYRVSGKRHSRLRRYIMFLINVLLSWRRHSLCVQRVRPLTEPNSNYNIEQKYGNFSCKFMFLKYQGSEHTVKLIERLNSVPALE